MVLYIRGNIFRPELEKCYNFTQLAVELNEPEDGVAPTDARLRPDQRKMEEGDWDEANRLKVLIEEKQRATRRLREREAAEAAAEGMSQTSYCVRPIKYSQSHTSLRA